MEYLGRTGNIVIEVEVHQQLKAFLRTQVGSEWPHHLTVARLAARAIRLQRNTTIQISSAAAYQGQYRLGYLAAILLWEGPVLLVAPEDIQRAICHIDLPRLREWLSFDKPICTTPTVPDPSFSGILLWSLETWLEKRLCQQPLPPADWPIVIDGAEYLEDYTRHQLTLTLSTRDWDELLWGYPNLTTLIRDVRVKLTKQIFHHPPNPYHCVVIDQPERSLLQEMLDCLQSHQSGLYLSKWVQLQQYLQDANILLWAEVDRNNGIFTVKGSPVEVDQPLKQDWLPQTNILISSGAELEAAGVTFPQRLDFAGCTNVTLAPERQTEAIQLFLPNGMPMPNTPEYEPALLTHLHQLLRLQTQQNHGFQVVIVGDSPLRNRVAAILASEFGSRVKVEIEDCSQDTILVTGWEFWQRSQRYLPKPQCLAIATLPFPSLEHPAVSGTVAHYKRQRQDWFRLFLLPEALQHLQKAIAPVRDGTGLVALFDNRVLHRSYGKQILSTLSPYARLAYLDESCLASSKFL